MKVLIVGGPLSGSYWKTEPAALEIEGGFVLKAPMKNPDDPPIEEGQSEDDYMRWLAVKNGVAVYHLWLIERDSGGVEPMFLLADIEEPGNRIQVVGGMPVTKGVKDA